MATDVRSPASLHARMPVVFVGHGNPMNAVEETRYAAAWRALGAALPRPKAVVCVSAHWYVAGTRVTAMARPRTIHDFGGFPDELSRVEYPAPGAPALARDLASRLAPTRVELDESWGLDHGAWSVLRRLYPDADVPVVQLSLDETLPPEAHYALGARLAPLREEGVLVLGSGNLVHNLHALSWGEHPARPYGWAVEFERTVRAFLDREDPGPLVRYGALGRAAALAVPTPDHYLPFLYTLALRAPGEPVSYPVEGIDLGSVSMLSVRFG